MKFSSFCCMSVCIAALFLSACSSKGGAKQDSGLEGSGIGESDLNAARDSRFGDGSIPVGDGDGPFRRVYFEYDSSTLSDSARQNIEYNVQVLERDASIKVQLEGHSDERGTAEYNLALGQRRAQAVYEQLVSYGISPSRLTTISYGEEVPAVPGMDESAMAKNRRVNFSGFTG